MKDWPKLSIEAGKRILAAECEAKRQLGDNIRPHTPGNPDWIRDRDNILDGGYRVIDFICGYAEALVDAHAAEYDHEALKAGGILGERIVPLARRLADEAWGGWMFAMAAQDPPRISHETRLKPGSIEFPLPPRVVRKTGVRKGVLTPSDAPPDPQLASGVAKLWERYRVQMEHSLEGRASHWERGSRQVVGEAAASPRSYAPLYSQLQNLIARSARVCNPDAGTSVAEIREWVREAHGCLSLLENQLPTTFAAFRRIVSNLEFRVEEDQEHSASRSAYRPEWTDKLTGRAEGADVLMDFEFDHLEQAARILKLFVRKLELEGYSLSGTDFSSIPPSLPPGLPVTSIDGSVRRINPEGSDPAETIWTPEDEKRISACVFDGRAAVRSELEGIFAGQEWPELAALIEPFRRYAVKVFDVYASAYVHVARTVAAYQEALDQLLLPMVLRDLFGHEWAHSPGEKVVRILWQDGPDGKQGREVEVVAGNDPDPACVFNELLSNAIEHRYRFFEPLPAPAPGEPPGINLSNLEWWQYIRLSERHSLAMDIKPYLEDRVAHWRFTYAPTAPANSSGTSDTEKGEVSRQPAQPESGTVMAQASMADRASSSSDASAMDSPTRIKFETGIALAEVTLDQDLKDHGPSLEIARKYVTNATLTLARCILTPNCAEPYEAIRRAYDFAEWFAGEAMKPAWVWLCVFSEMNTSGKLKKHNRDGRTEEGAPKRLSESEIRAWHGCLFGVAHEALDEFVTEFWKERLKHFSDIAGGGAPVESGTSRAAESDQDPGALVQEPSDLRVNSDPPEQEDTKPRSAKARKGDATLLGQKQFVSFKTAEQYLGISERQRQKLMNSGALRFEGQGHNRKITTESLKACLPPEIPN